MIFQTMYYGSNREDLYIGERIKADSWEEAESKCKKGFVSGLLVAEVPENDMIPDWEKEVAL